MNDTTDIPEENIQRVGAPDGRGGLYNVIFPDALERADVLLPLVALRPAYGHLYRVRDAWLEKDGTGRLFVHVYTRIGGNNREEYAAVIEKLRANPFYERDADDTVDNTYAGFWFRVPDQFADEVRHLAHDPINTDELWQKVSESLGKMDKESR